MDDPIDTDASEGTALRRWLRKDVVVWAGVGLVTCTIFVNALFLQSGPHPAPIFANKPPAPPAAPVVRQVATTGEATGALVLPRPRPNEAVPVRNDAPARSRGEIVADIQKELARRGFYSGATDGIYGAKTDAAIRDFEQAAGLRPGNMPDENLLRTIMGSNAKPRATAESKLDPIAELLAPPSRVLAAQRALAEYGYGQIKPNGVLGPETQAAIERFERERKLPITGQLSDNSSANSRR